MLSQRNQIEAFLKVLQVEIRANIKSKGKEATGDTGAALKVKMDKKGGELVGAVHMEALESGRGPTRRGRGPGPTLQQAVLRWIKAKGIRSELTDESLSWAISKSLHAKGDLLHQSRRHSGVLSEVINKETLKRFIKDFSGQELLRVGAGISQHWTTLGK